MNFEHAKHVKASEWAGWVYCPDVGDLLFEYQSVNRDGYFTSVKELLSAIECYNSITTDPIEVPDWVWACKPHNLERFDCIECVDRFLAHYEDAWDQLDTESVQSVNESIKALLSAIHKFHKVNGEIVVHYADYTLAVVGLKDLVD